MKILVTCNRYPSPPLDGLTLRIYHYARYLSDSHELNLICLGDRSEINQDIESFFRSVECYPQTPHNDSLNFFSKIFTGLDIRTLFPQSMEIKTKLNHRTNCRDYDLIWDAGCNMLFNLVALRRFVPLLADQVDDSFLRLKREFRLAQTLRDKLWILKQIALVWIFSVRHLRNADRILFVSEIDEASFKRFIPFTNTSVIANGVDEVYFDSQNCQQPDSIRKEIVFEGSMSFGPNIDAAMYFIKDILPRIRRKIPDVRFTAVGRDPSKELMCMVDDGITITGFVPDIRPFLQNAGVFVCPMRCGAGIKNKILQAWAMGKAVVSTREGAGGLNIDEGNNILIRDEPQAFAHAVIELLLDQTRAARLGAAGRTTVEKYYTWAVKAKQFETLMEDIVSHHSMPLT